MKWKKCRDGLPKNTEEFLVYDAEGNITCGYLENELLYSRYGVSARFWMPLPKPPKDEE